MELDKTNIVVASGDQAVQNVPVQPAPSAPMLPPNHRKHVVVIAVAVVIVLAILLVVCYVYFTRAPGPAAGTTLQSTSITSSVATSTISPLFNGTNSSAVPPSLPP